MLWHFVSNIQNLEQDNLKSCTVYNTSLCDNHFLSLSLQQINSTNNSWVYKVLDGVVDSGVETVQNSKKIMKFCIMANKMT
jgi:hypothetical protein